MKTQGQATFGIRFLVQLLVVLSIISFWGIMLQYGGSIVNASGSNRDQILNGIVLSMKDVRFNHTRSVLQSLGIEVVQKVPPSFESKEVDQELERHVGSRQYHTTMFLKVWSNRMSFLECLEEFILDPYATRHTWRFFFEDDVAIHPNITSQRAKMIFTKGLALAEKEGFLYLGICGPSCTDPQVLDDEVEAARCSGTCAHAFGFQQWKAAEFLTDMVGVTLKGAEGPVILSFYFDRYLVAFAQMVEKLWVIGSNLKSPVRTVTDHFGLLYQDRFLFQSEIST